MQGLTWASLKKHPSLIPLYFFVGAGALASVFYTLRLATKNPDVAWVKRPDGALSNEDYANKQYKFYSPTIDYSKLKTEAPKYKE